MAANAVWHWWRFHTSDAKTEPDVGQDVTHLKPLSAGVGTGYTSQQDGPLLGGEVTFSVAMTDVMLERASAMNVNEFSTGGYSDKGTIVLWFKTAGTATIQYLFGAHPSNRSFSLMMQTDGRLRWTVIRASDATEIYSVDSFNDDQWHFLALTCDSTNPTKMYVDGVEVAYTTTTAGAGLGDHPWLTEALGGSTLAMKVGNDARSVSDPTNYDLPFIGNLAELAFFKIALSATVIAQLYGAGIALAVLPAGSEKEYLDLDLPMTNTAYMAQRLCYRRLLTGQRQKTLSVPANLRAMQFAVSDVLSMTIADLSMTAATYRMAGWKLSDGITIELGLREDDSAAYLDPPTALYHTPTSLPSLTPGTVQVPPPTALTATAALEGISLAWTAPDNLLGVHHYAIYSNTTSAWSGASLVGTTLSTTFLHMLATTGARYYWVRSVDASGFESIRAPDSDTSTVTATFTAGTTAVPSAPQTLGGIDGTPATGNLTGSFTRAGTTVASRIFTATHSGGNLTYSAGADSGEATTHSATGSGTPTLVVTHRHTGSGQTTTLTFTVA